MLVFYQNGQISQLFSNLQAGIFKMLFASYNFQVSNCKVQFERCNLQGASCKMQFASEHLVRILLIEIHNPLSNVGTEEKSQNNYLSVIIVWKWDHLYGFNQSQTICKAVWGYSGYHLFLAWGWFISSLCSRQKELLPDIFNEY